MNGCHRCKKDVVFCRRVKTFFLGSETPIEYDMYLCTDHPHCPGRAIDNVVIDGKHIDLPEEKP